MPETIGGYLIETFAIEGISAQALGSAVIQTTLVVANYAYQQQQAKRAEAAMADQLSRDKQLTTVRATAAVRPMVLGRTRVGGVITHAFVTGTNNEYLHFGVAICGHEIDAIEEIYLNDEALGALDDSSTTSGGGGFVTTGRYARETTTESGWVTTFPSVGSSVALPSGTIQVISVAPYDTLDGALNEGEYFEIVKSGSTPTHIKNLSADFVGRSMTVTLIRKVSRPLVRVFKFLGLPDGERDEVLEAECAAAGYDSTSGFWSTDVGCSIARIHVRLEMDQTVFGSVGIPNITCLVRGAKARDWSTGTTSWTRNAARLVAWYIQRPEAFRAAVTDFDADLMLAAQQVCDETVTTASGSQARYTLDGVIYPDTDPLQTLSMMQTAMAGEVVPCGGTWDVRAGAWDPPEFTLTDDMITGEGMSVSPARTRAKKFNSVRGKFSDPSILYNDNDIPPYPSETYIEQDGDVELWTDIDLPFTTDVEAAQRIHRIYLHKERNPLSFRCTTSMKAYALRAGQNCYVKASAYGWEGLNGGLGKLFHVVRRSLRTDGKIEFTMVETASEIFDWTYDEATIPDPTPDTAWPRWDYVEPVRSLGCSTSGSTYSVDGDGNVVPYAQLTWADPSQTLYADAVIVTRWKKAAETSYREERSVIGQGGVRLRGVAAGDLITFGVQVTMPNGARSETVFGSHNASSSLPTQGVPASSLGTGGNDLQNSDLAFGVGFLSVYAPGFVTDAAGITQSTASDQRIPGTPTNGIMYQQGTETTGYIDGQWPPVSVTGGEKRGVQVMFHPIRCQNYVRIEWRKSDGSPSSHPADYGNIVNDPSSAGLGYIGAYQPSTWIGTVPSDATNAVVHVWQSHTLTGSDSVSGFAKPQFRRLADDATEIPEYSSGPTGYVGTTQIEPQAATGLIEGSVATQAIADGGTLYCQADSAYTAVRACDVVVSTGVSLDLQANTVTGRPSKYAYGLRVEQSLDAGATWSPILASSGGVAQGSTAGGHILDLPTGSRRGVSISVPACRVAVANGASALFRARINLDRGVQAISAANFSITVQVIKA